jgi:shikimate dehydrogenase
MHLAAWQSLSIAAEYFRIEVPVGELEKALPQLLQAGLAGWNCTLPHKTEMFRLSQVRDSSAIQAQSVNTVHIVEGRIYGSSTDAAGWARAMCEVWPNSLPPGRTLLLGCGGVGQSIARFLVPTGCTSLTLVNRDPLRAQELLRELTPLVAGRFPIRQIEWDLPALEKALTQTDLLIHGTSLGLKKEDPLPVPEKFLKAPLRVYDTIYKTDSTPLVRAARQRGCQAEDGLGMLLHQGALSFEIWSKKPAPLNEMRQALFQAAGRAL